MLKYIDRIRFIVYAMGVLAIGITSCNLLDAEMFNHFAKKGKDKDRKDFCPPDLVPHPNLPQPERIPKGGTPCDR